MIRPFSVFIILIALCTSLIAQEKQTKSFKSVELKRTDLYAITNRFSGMFSSEEQANTDPHYLHVTMVMKPIWTHRHDGYWMYIEQAEAATPDKPYRQRVYHLFRSDKFTIVSEVYELPNPQAYIGEWRNTNPLASMTPEMLKKKNGCDLSMHKNEFGQFWGNNNPKECVSSLGKNTYTVSNVLIDEEKMITWDRGVNKKEAHVWGAVKGGYEFLRTSDNFGALELPEKITGDANINEQNAQ